MKKFIFMMLLLGGAPASASPPWVEAGIEWNPSPTPFMQGVEMNSVALLPGNSRRLPEHVRSIFVLEARSGYAAIWCPDGHWVVDKAKLETASSSWDSDPLYITSARAILAELRAGKLWLYPTPHTACEPIKDVK